MAAQEDPALLFLIFQHLKVNGFTKAARVLEKHLVPQVETPPAESLHEIYSGWMKLCSLAKHAKQEADDSLNSKRVKVEFIPSEEEAADSKLCGVSGEDELKAELLHDCESDIVESSHPEENPESQFEPQHEATTSVPVKELDGESCGSSVTEMEEEKTKEEQEASIEESAEVSNEEKVSSDTQETVKSSQPECDLALHGESTEGPQEDAEASKGLITNSSTSEVAGEAPASERTDSDLTKTADVLDEEKDEEKSTLEPTDLITIDLTEETNDHLVERQAPPPADFATEKPKDEEEQEEEQVEQDEENDNKSESVGGADVPSELYPDAAAEKPTEAQAQKQTEAADLLTPHSDVPEEPNVSINIQADAEAAPQESSQSVPEESSESCADSKTPKKKKKKKNKRNMETPGTDTLVTETPSTNASDPGDTPLTSKSSKKKRRHQRREKDDQKEEAAEEEEEVEVFIPAAASEKKKAKKRKRDKEAAGTTFETKTISKHVGEDLGEENTPAETTGKPKKKKRKKEKEAPSEDAPAEGDDETEKTDSIDDGSTALLFSGKKKKHLCRKLSLRRRPRFYGKREKMNEMMNSIHRRQKLEGKKKLKEETLDEKSQMNPVKRAQADDETEIKAPKRRRRKKKKKMIIMEQEESSLKENEPPGKQKKSMQTRDKNGVGEELLEEDVSLLSNEGKKKKKKKKVKDENVEESTGAVDVSQPPLSKKKKKSSLKAGLEDAGLDTGLDADSHTPTKKKRSSS